MRAKRQSSQIFDRLNMVPAGNIDMQGDSVQRHSKDKHAHKVVTPTTTTWKTFTLEGVNYRPEPHTCLPVAGLMSSAAEWLKTVTFLMTHLSRTTYETSPSSSTHAVALYGISTEQSWVMKLVQHKLIIFSAMELSSFWSCCICNSMGLDRTVIYRRCTLLHLLCLLNEWVSSK